MWSNPLETVVRSHLLKKYWMENFILCVGDLPRNPFYTMLLHCIGWGNWNVLFTKNNFKKGFTRSHVETRHLQQPIFLFLSWNCSRSIFLFRQLYFYPSSLKNRNKNRTYFCLICVMLAISLFHYIAKKKFVF